MSKTGYDSQMRPVTLKDVARRAGVSYKTVSNVVHSSALVRPETRERVLEAIRALDYRPSAAARALVTRRRHMIGLLLFDITNFAYPEIAEVVVHLAREAGFMVLLCNTGRERAEEDRYVDLLSEQQVDGVIIAAQWSDSTAAEVLSRRDIKVVTMSGDPNTTVVPYVGLDDEGSAFEATQHLIDLGHRRIGFVHGSERSAAHEERWKGYLRALSTNNMSADPSLVISGVHSVDATRRVARELLTGPDRPTAVFAAADVMALPVIDAAIKVGLRVPEDLAIVGFDDIPLVSNAAISLSSVGGDLHMLASEATSLLLTLILHPETVREDQPIRRVFPATLHIRRSSGGPVGGA